MIYLLIFVLVFVDIDFNINFMGITTFKFHCIITKIFIPEYDVFYFGNSTKILDRLNKQLEEHKSKRNL